MSASARKKGGNRDTIGDNENLLDFLKRKKQFNLENTVSKSFGPHSHTKKKVDFELNDDFPAIKEDRTRHHQYQSGREASRAARQTITPRKLDFD